MPILNQTPSGQRSSSRRKRSTSKQKRGSAQKKKSRLTPLDGALILALVIIIICAVAIPQLRELLATTEEELISSQVEILVHSRSPYTDSGYIDNGDGTIAYEDDNYTSAAGVDVSSHQGEIDWEAAAQDGLSFAIVRLGWRGYTAGELCKDEMAVTNLQQAKANGLQVGAYFYSQATTPQEAREEARLALEVLGGLALDLPIYYDWELDPHEGSRSADMDYTVLTECALAFCTTIEAGGYDAGIYFYRSLGEDTYDLTQLENYDFWLSHPSDRPTFNHTYSIWQYTYEGQVDGITTNVDRDLMYIPKSSLSSDTKE